MHIEQVSETTVMVRAPEPPSPKLTYRLLALKKLLFTHFDLAIEDCVIAFNTIMICLNTTFLTPDKLLQFLQRHLSTLTPLLAQPNEQPCLDIPVYYGKETGPDLEIVAEHAHMSVEEVIQAHASRTYFVYATGFLPGFAFLGFVPNALAIARKDSPRQSVPKGSVGIAERQTGVYPHQSPGGWQIIGQTPIELASKPQPDNRTHEKYEDTLQGYFHVGGSVRFYPINKTQFDNWNLFES